MFVPQSKGMIGLYIAGAFVVGILFLIGLMMMPRKMRKPVVIAVTFLLGWFYLFEFLIPGSHATAPVRSELASSEAYLLASQQDLYALVVMNKKGNPAQRISHSNAALTSALEHIYKAQAGVESLIPKTKAEYLRAAQESERWAKDHNVSKDLLTRGSLDDQSSDNSIMDTQTLALQNQYRNLNAALEQIKDAKQIAEGAKSAAIDPGSKAAKAVWGAVGGAAKEVSLARTTISDNFLTPYKQPLGDVSVVLGAFTLGLGIFSLMSLHGRSIIRKRPGWGNSLAFYIALVSITALAFLQRYMHPGLGQSFSKSLYDILFNGALVAFSATMFSLVAFYIVSAAYRAFRIKSGESALMMIAAFIVMLAVVPFGVWMTSGFGGWASIFRLENIGHWIMSYPNAAAQRGIAFGIGIGGLAMGLRLWLSLERGSYFDKQM